MRSRTTLFTSVLILGASLLALNCGEDDGGDDLSPWPEARDPYIHAANFPQWTFSMKLWPFDILTPQTSQAETDEALANAVDEGATAVIFYIEEEHMYGTFVDDTGFTDMIEKIEHLTGSAATLGLHTIVYVNGLEVMTRGAFDRDCNPTGIPTMASEYPDWLQLDLDGDPIVFECQNTDWLEPDWEDAWMSPLSGYRDLFKERIESLALAGVEGIYIDATFLPGFQPEDDDFRMGSTDPAFVEAFTTQTGYNVPTGQDFEEENFREFLLFRHQVLAEYLEDLADTAWEVGLVPFWESSTNDTPEGTTLGNETAVTGRSGLGYSPEIEPEGEWLAAFRIAKAARELNQERPMIYLGWPEEDEQATMEFALAIAHSGNYYPTNFLVAEGAFDLMDEIGDVLDLRVPYGGDVALVYSFRNQDFSFEDESFFDAYVEAFEELVTNHVPFRIVPLEYIEEDGVEGVETVVLPGIQGISDEEAYMINSKSVVLFGDDIATRDEGWDTLDDEIEFDDVIDLEDVGPALPFGIDSPEETFIEFYGHINGNHAMYLFAVSPDPQGEITLSAADGTSLQVTTYRLDDVPTDDYGEKVTVEIDSNLLVLFVSEN